MTLYVSLKDASLYDITTKKGAYCVVLSW